MKTVALKQVQYDPSVFLDVDSVEDAVRVILTPEDGLSSMQRWKAEAPYLMGLLERNVGLPLHKANVLDYGCGIGRMAKPLIDKHQCQVVGVDISPNMRALAASCVDSDRFFALAPSMLWHLTPAMFDGALAIWTLQHVLDLKAECERIQEMLRPSGWLFVVNNKQRVIPASDGRWIDDQIDVRETIIAAGFSKTASGELAGADIAPGYLARNTFWAMYRKA